MYLQITLINAILFASLASASDTKLNTQIENFSPTIATTFPASENLILKTGTDFFIPNVMLDKKVELTPEESQMRRVKLGKILARLSKSIPGKIEKFKPSKLLYYTTILPETDGQYTNTPITSDIVTVPDSGNVEDTEVDYSADGERNTSLDTSPEETELRRGGRGGRGGRGRGRFGRGGRIGRFGGRRLGRFGRFGRFGGWGSGWNNDCGGNDCGDC